MGSCLSCCKSPVDPDDKDANSLEEPFITDSTDEGDANEEVEAEAEVEAAPKSKSRGVTCSPSVPLVSSSENGTGSNSDFTGGENENRDLVLTQSVNFYGISDERLTDLEKLEKQCPLATKEERQRFLNAKDGDYDLALEQLSAYLEWRELHNLDTLPLQLETETETETESSSPLALTSLSETLSHDDEDDFQSCCSTDETLDCLDWRYASDKALAYYSADGNGGKKSNFVVTLPQLARLPTFGPLDEHVRDTNGDRILHFLPAQMDPSLGDDDTFTLCIAFYLERKLRRDSMEKLAICIDVRGGRGWNNPRASTTLPFIKKVTACLERNFPERMQKSIVYPMPRIAMGLWKLVKIFLDENTAGKIALVGGNASTEAQPPYKKLEPHIEYQIIKHMEAIRIESFII